VWEATKSPLAKEALDPHPLRHRRAARDRQQHRRERHARHRRSGGRIYLFAGSDTGGDRAAAIYTIVQTAKHNDVNPEGFLRDALAKIADGHPISRIEELMPWA
jgi:hypothetical protein